MEWWNNTGNLTTLLFHTYQQNINVCYQINQVCCFPGNTQNFRTDWIIKYFRWYIAIQIEHVILHIREKGKALNKLLSGKSSIK